MKKDRFEKGFTLIELLVVIAIIAILAAILFPVFTRAKDKGRQTACLSNMRQVGYAYIMYSGEYGALVPVWAPGRPANAPPPAFSSKGTRIQWYEPGSWTWSELLYPYVRSAKVFQCPSAVNVYPPRDGHLGTSYKTVFWSGSRDHAGTPPMSTLGNYGPYSTPESAVARPKESIILTDTKSVASAQQWDEGRYVNVAREILFNWKLDTNPAYDDLRPHFNQPNFLFCDGHASNGPYSKYAKNRHWYIDKYLPVSMW